MTESGAVAQRAGHLIELRRYDEALQVVLPALSASPQHHTLLRLAAQAHLLRGDAVAAEPPDHSDYLAATDLAGRAVAVDPHDDWGLRLLSLAQSRLGLGWAAAQSAYAAVSAAPFAYETHVRYADALSALGTEAGREQARAEARRAVELAPHQPEAHLVVARVAHPAGGGRGGSEGRQVARRAVQTALALDPGNSVALSELARLDLSSRRRVQAASGFTDALRADPGNRVARHNLAIVLGSWLRPAHYLVFAAVWLTWHVPSGSSAARPTRVVAASVVLAVVAVVALRMRRAVPGDLAGLARVFGQLGPWAVLWAVSLTVAVVLLVASAALPGGAGSLALGGAVVVLLVGVVSSWLGPRQRRRARGR